MKDRLFSIVKVNSACVRKTHYKGMLNAVQKLGKTALLQEDDLLNWSSGCDRAL